MNKSKFLFSSNPNANLLEAIDLANAASDKSQSISKSQLLLITLSTTVMTALKKPLSKEYYQYTRAFLDTIKNEDGTSLPNISKLVEHINWFEESNNISDELVKIKDPLLPEEVIEIRVEEVLNEMEVTPIPNHTGLSSTKYGPNDPGTSVFITGNDPNIATSKEPDDPRTMPQIDLNDPNIQATIDPSPQIQNSNNQAPVPLDSNQIPEVNAENQSVAGGKRTSKSKSKNPKS